MLLYVRYNRVTGLMFRSRFAVFGEHVGNPRFPGARESIYKSLNFRHNAHNNIRIVETNLFIVKGQLFTLCAHVILIRFT